MSLIHKIYQPVHRRWRCQRGAQYIKHSGIALYAVQLPPLHWRHYCQKPSAEHLPELTLYTKTPCPLCDEALEALSPALHRVTLRKVDITLPENRRWYKLYRYDIPVFHFDGAFLMKHRADVPALLRALEKWEASPSR